MTKILMDKNIEVEVDLSKSKKCECGAVIYFGRTKNNKWMPIHKIVNGYAPHWGNCPLESKFKK